MEERGCEGGIDEVTATPVTIKIATYNILNTKGKHYILIK